MRLLLLALFTAVFCIPTSSSQIMNPVKWSYSAEYLGGDEYNLIFEAKIDKGWILYSQFLDQGGPIPTSFTFDEGKFKLIGKALESDNVMRSHDPIFDMELAKFSDNATFTQRIKVTDTSKPVTGYLTFMCCDHNRCLPPKDVNFEITLPPPAKDKSDAGNDNGVSDIAQTHLQRGAKGVIFEDLK